MSALNVRNDEAHALAREIAALTGLSLTDAVIDALRRRRDDLLAQTGPDRELVERFRDYHRHLRAAHARSH